MKPNDKQMYITRAELEAQGYTIDEQGDAFREDDARFFEDVSAGEGSF